MTTDQSQRAIASHRVSDRLEHGRMALLTLLRRGDNRLLSSVRATEPDELVDDPLAEAAHRFPLLSNFRSRSRHRRGMPSPVSNHR